MEREHNDRAWLAWHAGALPMMTKPPKLSEWLIPVGRSRKRQSADEMLAILMSMAAGPAN